MHPSPDDNRKVLAPPRSTFYQDTLVRAFALQSSRTATCRPGAYLLRGLSLKLIAK